MVQQYFGKCFLCCFTSINGLIPLTAMRRWGYSDSCLRFDARPSVSVIDNIVWSVHSFIFTMICEVFLCDAYHPLFLVGMIFGSLS